MSVPAAGDAGERAVVVDDPPDLEAAGLPELSHRRERHDRRRRGHTPNMGVRGLRRTMGRLPDAEDRALSTRQDAGRPRTTAKMRMICGHLTREWPQVWWTGEKHRKPMGRATGNGSVLSISTGERNRKVAST
jgi:hypothetical protein